MLLLGHVFHIDCAINEFTKYNKEPNEVCEHPEKLNDKPGNCTSKQKRECHGDVEDHLCE